MTQIISPPLITVEPDMNAASSLFASADLAKTKGRPDAAETYRTLARNAAAFGELGNALYRHFAKEAAEYTTALRDNQEKPQ